MSQTAEADPFDQLIGLCPATIQSPAELLFTEFMLSLCMSTTWEELFIRREAWDRLLKTSSPEFTS